MKKITYKFRENYKTYKINIEMLYMEKLVYGDKKDEEMGNFENVETEMLTPQSNFEKLRIAETRQDEDFYYIFTEAQDYSKSQWDKIKQNREFMDYLILSKDKDSVPDSILEHVREKKIGETRQSSFFSKLKALRVDEPTPNQVEKLKQLPLNYIIEKLGEAESDMYPELQEKLDFVNQRLFEADQEILTSYLAHSVKVPDKTLFYNDKWNSQYEDLVEQLSRVEEMSEQEVERNLKVLMAKNYKKFESDIKDQITDRKELPEVEENMNKTLGEAL